MHAPLRPFCLDEYHRLGALGFFRDERVELIHGAIVQMSPQGAPHVVVVRRLNRLLSRAVGPEQEVQVQGPVILGESEPEPDLALIPMSAEKATTATVLIEVADSSLDYDRTTKAQLYAEANIPEYWVVDLVNWQLLVHTDPAGGVYKTTRRHLRGDVVQSPCVPCAVDVTALFADL